MELSHRALNRATLARQHLLRRSAGGAFPMVEHLAGMQGQDPELPYLGLWNRLAGFRRDELTALLDARQVVRGTLFRGTQHVLTAPDYRWIRPLLQPMLAARQRGTFGRRLTGVDPSELAGAARERLGAGVLSRMELGRALAGRWPETEPEWLARAVQGLLPVVHPAPAGVWGHRGPTPFALAETFLPGPLRAGEPSALVLRYLAAFGPASVRDMQAWSGMTGLGPAFEELRPRLCTFRSPAGAELFDLPDAPRPGPDVPAPVRFLPGFDNVLYGHADRARIMADAHRRPLLDGAALLVDGVVRGVWKIKQGRLTVRLFDALQRSERDAVTAEGSRLIAFAAPGAELRLAAA